MIRVVYCLDPVQKQEFQRNDRFLAQAEESVQKPKFRRNCRVVARCGSVWYRVFYKSSTVGATE
jgi:hypothetical protein